MTIYPLSVNYCIEQGIGMYYSWVPQASYAKSNASSINPTTDHVFTNSFSVVILLDYWLSLSAIWINVSPNSLAE